MRSVSLIAEDVFVIMCLGLEKSVNFSDFFQLLTEVTSVYDLKSSVIFMNITLHLIMINLK